VEASIALSTFNARQLRLRGFQNITVIPFHKDFTGVRYEVHRKFPYYDRSPVYRILYVGRITKHKCQRDLVDFVKEVRSVDGVPLEVVLVGHWEHGREYKAEIDEDVRRFELGDNVVMTGSIPDEELLGYYRAASAYVSLSEHEGFGIPLIE